ncbi:silencing defective protein Sde2 [Homalodisca vitripennis]|nr:silencing defective protein Sde2 [Homalodisca vitripennis]
MYYCNLSMLGKPHDNSLSANHYFVSQEQLESWISEKYDLNRQSYYVMCNGKKVYSICGESRTSESIFYVVPKILGGKGGFGSMLRAIGAQIEKTTNREACRDLSGRRLRDINEEQRLKNWISQQAEREREAAERKKQKLERLCQEPKYEFKDDGYDKSRSTMPEEMSSSVDQGFKASTSKTSNSLSGAGKTKRKHSEEPEAKLRIKKKRNLWIDAEESDSNSSDISEENDKKTLVGLD